MDSPDRFRDLARIAGDLGADELVHDAVALADRKDVSPEMAESAVERFVDRLKFEIEERRAALMRPPALSGSHAAELRTSIANAQQWLRDLSTEADPLEERLRTERETFLARNTTVQFDGAKNRRAALEQANELAATRIRAWEASLADELRPLHAGIVARHIGAMQALIERIRATGVPVEGEIVVDATYMPPTVQLHTVTPPFRWRRPRLHDEAREVYQQALAVGSQQIIDAFHEAMMLSRRRIEWEIALRLRATADALKRAADTARSAQSEGASGIAVELNRLDELSRRLAAL